MASNNDAPAVATYRDFNPEVAAKAAAEDGKKAAAKPAAEKKES